MFYALTVLGQFSECIQELGDETWRAVEDKTDNVYIIEILRESVRNVCVAEPCGAG
jgi:hypothetical protein